MKTIVARCLMLSVGLLMMACGKKSMLDADTDAGARAVVAGEIAKPGALLAYEHELSFVVAPDSMQRRITAVQTACSEEKYGACSVLGIESNTGNYATASIKLRMVPAGIENMIALAGERDAASTRKTKADDLADAVADVAAQQDLLQRQRDTLLTYVQRKDIAVADMITVSQQLASIESTLHGLAQQAADQRRRIETNLLTIDLRSNAAPARMASEFSFREAGWMFVDSLAEGATAAAEYAGFFLPLMLLVFPMALLWRWAWRRATRRSAALPPN